MKSVFPAVLASFLVACGPQPGEPAANVATASPVPLPSAPSATTAPSDAPSPVERIRTGPVSCADEIGIAAARQLVDQCVHLSPATHPPCNVRNSCAMIRREIARSCSVIDDGGKAPPDCPAHPATSAAAVEAVRIYYAAIDARDYATAWQLWDGNGERSGKSLADFRAGFADTVSSSVSPGTPAEPEGAAGSSYVTVPVTVTARLRDGTRQRFTGRYVLRRSNVERSQGWAIYSATLTPAG